MTDCEKLLLFSQNELSAQEHAAMKQHIQTCSTCQKQMAFLRKLDEVLVAPAAPPELMDQLFSKTTRSAKVQLPLWRRIALAGISVAIMGVVCWNMLDSSANSFNSREVVAYMQMHLEEDYQELEAELSALEADFK